jgi:hypothetical protein
VSEIEDGLNAEATFQNIKMERASKADIAKASMIEYDASRFKGEGPIYYVCECCGEMILKGMSAQQSEALASVLFACTPCNLLMRIPARTTRRPADSK